MPFRCGSVSYRRFRLSPLTAPTSAAAADLRPRGVDDALLAKLAENRLQPPSVGAPPELQAGFVAGRHLLDEAFDHAVCGFGPLLLAGLRIDINRMPAELRRAYRAIEESARAASSSTGFLSRAERRLAREEADRRCEAELAEGLHRRSRMLPILWDVPKGLLLAPISGERIEQAMRDLFQNALELRMQGRSAGALAWDLLADRGLGNALDDTRPTAFTVAPTDRGAERSSAEAGGQPDVPWAQSGPEPKDFLGNEFLLWLWCITETGEGLIETPAASAGGVGEVAVVIDRSLELDCAWGITGRTSLRGEAPTRRAEATKALQHGKWLRRCGLIVAAGGQQWQLDLQGDRFAVSSAILPPIEKAETQREETEQRLALTLELDRVLVALYETFLRVRVSSDWLLWQERIGDWIAARAAGSASVHAARPAAIDDLAAGEVDDGSDGGSDDTESGTTTRSDATTDELEPVTG